LIQQSFQKKIVLCPAPEIPAATQHERLIHCLLEATMTLLDVAVLIRLLRLNLLARHPVVIQQRPVTPRELLRVRTVVHRQAHPVRAMTRRRPAQLPERVLQTLAQTLKTLRKADRRRLPVRVRQNEVVDQVIETLRLDRDSQGDHRREVRGTQPTRFMHLRKKHLLRRTRLPSPTFDMPLQRPQLRVRKTLRISPLQLLEDRLGLQARVAFEQFTDFAPNRLERIGPRYPIVRLGDFAR
jgi:hypothetical protein